MTQREVLRVSVVVVTAAVMGWLPALAFEFSDVRGHMGFGYSKLFATDAPGGSLSGAAGIDAPLGGRFGIGVGLGFHLLGGRTVERGSLLANLDYSMVEATLLAHWTPPWPGPVGRISAGPALIGSHAELSTSGGGAAFADLAVEETGPGVALDVTLMKREVSPVRVGVEFAGRYAFLEDEDWLVASARLVFHY